MRGISKSLTEDIYSRIAADGTEGRNFTEFTVVKQASKYDSQGYILEDKMVFNTTQQVQMIMDIVIKTGQHLKPNKEYVT